MNVLVLCHGNAYRSPLAAAVMRHYVAERASKSLPIVIRSRGFLDHNRMAAKPIREAAEERGLDLSAHRSKMITMTDVYWSDIILYMNQGNLKRLKELIGNDLAGDLDVRPLGRYATRKTVDIKDPAFMKAGSEELEYVVNQIESASINFIKGLEK